MAGKSRLGFVLLVAVLGASVLGASYWRWRRLEYVGFKEAFQQPLRTSPEPVQPGAAGAAAPPRVALRMRRGFIERDARRYLWGGPEEHQHFDVTEFRLQPEGLRYGLGREAFPALIEPEFESAEEADQWLPGSERVIGVSIDGDTRVYPVRLLLRHEVVNDVVGGRPVFACYCILADYGAVYERTMADHVFTFGVSGYTYGEENIRHGRQAFVLWDRDTESLWWPLTNRAVSGPALDQPMKLLESGSWEDTTWAEFRAKHPDAQVLRRDQSLERPKDWPKYTGPLGRGAAKDSDDTAQ